MKNVIPKAKASIKKGKVDDKSETIVFIKGNDREYLYYSDEHRHLKVNPWHLTEIQEEQTYNVVICDDFKEEFIQNYLETLREETLIYRRLKKDGQFFRYFDSLLSRLFSELKGKSNHDFKGGKIPKDELEFLKAVSDVVNNRIDLIEANENTTQPYSNRK